MDFISNKTPQIDEMLKAIGFKKIDDLFSAIPEKLKVKRPSSEDGLSEFEGLQLMEELASKNTFPSFENYLGAGSYQHHIPALMSAICSKSEFLTSYTPYQAEASQGMLQIIFEFQTAICGLTGMDVANASVYDGASACAEAVLMALRCNQPRKKIVIAETVHPHYRGVVKQYLSSHRCPIEVIPFRQNGQIEDFSIDRETAAVLIQSPNFFGVIEEMGHVAEKAKEAGALTILCGNPLSYGIYASPAELGVDIAVGDCQPFGIPILFGGPYAGYMSCRQELVRQMPGRIAGETVDRNGKRGYVLTMQAREQHIRREKATSNICTNQALAASASLIAILWYGKEGIPVLALTNYQRASYLRNRLAEIRGVKIDRETPIFNEFVVEFSQPLEKVQEQFRKRGIEPGVPLSPYFPPLKNHLLVCVTETKSHTQLDNYLSIAREICR